MQFINFFTIVNLGAFKVVYNTKIEWIVFIVYNFIFIYFYEFKYFIYYNNNFFIFLHKIS